MRSDFINKRQPLDRRNVRFLSGSSGETGPQTIEKEIFLLPTFDTFIFHNPIGSPGGDRWNVLTSGLLPDQSTQIPIGYLNPWNDGSMVAANQLIAPRTPTRGVFSYDLSQVPAGANILSASMNLSISSSEYISPLLEFLYTDGSNKGNWKEQALPEGGPPITSGVFVYENGFCTSKIDPYIPASQNITKNWLRNEKEYTQGGDSPTQNLANFDFVFSWTGNLVGPYDPNQALEIGFMRSHSVGDNTQEDLLQSRERFIGFCNPPKDDADQSTWNVSIFRKLPEIPAIYQESFAAPTSASMIQENTLVVIVYDGCSKAKFFVNGSQIAEAVGASSAGQMPFNAPQALSNTLMFSGFNHRSTFFTNQINSVRTNEMWCRKYKAGTLTSPDLIAAEKNAGWIPQTFTP